jgi:hypothetical protein
MRIFIVYPFYAHDAVSVIHLMFQNFGQISLEVKFQALGDLAVKGEISEPREASFLRFTLSSAQFINRRWCSVRFGCLQLIR